MLKSVAFLPEFLRKVMLGDIFTSQLQLVSVVKVHTTCAHSDTLGMIRVEGGQLLLSKLKGAFASYFLSVDIILLKHLWQTWNDGGSIWPAGIKLGRTYFLLYNRHTCLGYAPGPPWH